MSSATLPARPDTNGAPAAPARKRDFLTLLEAKETKAEIQRLVADPKQADKIIRTVRTAWQLDPNLQQCTPGSILTACMKACELNLVPGNTRKHAWLIPYNTKQKDGSWAKECTFQLGYLGVLELARRSREFKAIEAVVVYEADDFRFYRDPAPHIEHLPALAAEPGRIVAVYAYAKLQSDDFVVEVMPTAVVDKIRASSKQSDGPAWKNWYDQMACRSVLNRLLKRQASSIEVSEAVAHIEATEFDLDRQTITVSPGSTRTQALTETLRSRRAPDAIDPPSETENESQEVPGGNEAEPVIESWRTILTATADKTDAPAETFELIASAVLGDLVKAKVITKDYDSEDKWDWDKAGAHLEHYHARDADGFRRAVERAASKLK